MGFPLASGFRGRRDAGPLMALNGIGMTDCRHEVTYFQIFFGPWVGQKGCIDDSTPLGQALAGLPVLGKAKPGWMNPEPGLHGGLRGMGSEARCLASFRERESSLGIILR